VKVFMPIGLLVSEQSTITDKKIGG